MVSLFALGNKFCSRSAIIWPSDSGFRNVCLGMSIYLIYILPVSRANQSAQQQCGVLKACTSPVIMAWCAH